MVIRLVAHGDLLFLDLPPQLSVHPLSHRSGRRHRVVTKNLAQVVEQPGGRQEYIGPAHPVEVFQKEGGVLVPCSADWQKYSQARPRSCLTSWPVKYSFPRVYWAYWFPCSAESVR